MPVQDLFQIVHRHGAGELKADPTWPGGIRREQVLYIEMLTVSYTHLTLPTILRV